MRQVLPFNVPFSGFTNCDFINCFASAFMYIEKTPFDVDYECKKNHGQPCVGCGNCRNSAANVQEQLFFLFDAMSGRSSLRCQFGGRPTEMQRRIGETDEDGFGTDETVDFLFGFAAYDYIAVEDGYELMPSLCASIDGNKPVIARVKSKEGRFRVISGYDGELLICPDFANAQKKPEGAPLLEEVEKLYVFGDKVAPRYTLVDGLERIQMVMQFNANEKLWDEFLERIGWYGPNGMSSVDLVERKARMKRVADTMWHTFNCHNFAEVFRNCRYEELRNPAFSELWKRIGGPCYGYTHDLAWALIGLEEQMDLSKHYVFGIAEMVELTISQIKKNDEQVLEAIEQAIQILRSASSNIELDALL